MGEQDGRTLAANYNGYKASVVLFYTDLINTKNDGACSKASIRCSVNKRVTRNKQKQTKKKKVLITNYDTCWHRANNNFKPVSIWPLACTVQTPKHCRSYYVEIKCQLDATDDIYCRFYGMLNMFRTILCPSSGAREYYTDGRCLWYLVLWFSSCRYGVELKVMCPVCRLLQQPANRTHDDGHSIVRNMLSMQ